MPQIQPSFFNGNSMVMVICQCAKHVGWRRSDSEQGPVWSRAGTTYLSTEQLYELDSYCKRLSVTHTGFSFAKSQAPVYVPLMWEISFHKDQLQLGWSQIMAAVSEKWLYSFFILYHILGKYFLHHVSLLPSVYCCKKQKKTQTLMLLFDLMCVIPSAFTGRPRNTDHMEDVSAV